MCPLKLGVLCRGRGGCLPFFLRMEMEFGSAREDISWNGVWSGDGLISLDKEKGES